MRVDDVEVIVEGAGAATIVMIHGWPDSYRLWNAQVAALKDRYRCVRFSLPGFERAGTQRAYALDEVVETIRHVVEHVSRGERATLLLHDWGCFYGYQLAMRYPQLVERLIGVDVGDAGSRRNLAELGSKGKLMVLAYQLWLAMAWRIGGRVGDAMARAMARLLRCPTDPATIHSQMGYPYAVRWLGAAGGLQGVRLFEPQVPMLFLYGERKPLMFHSRAWAQHLATQPKSRALGFATGHWVMIGREREFNAALVEWLGETDTRLAA